MTPIVAAAAAVAAVYLASAAVLRSSMFAANPQWLAAAVAFDLIVTSTALVYWIAVRPGHLPRAALVVSLLAGVVAANLLLPAGHQGVARLLATGWIAVELVMVTLVAIRLRRVVGAYRRAREAGDSPVTSLENALTAALGSRSISRMAATELAIVGNGTVGLFRKGRPPAIRDRDHAVWGAVVAGLSIAVLGEGLAVHFIVRTWSTSAAWVVSGLHLYSLIWLLGDARALQRSAGIVVTDDVLELDLGLRARATIPRGLIASVAIGEGDGSSGAARAHILGQSNVTIHLSEPVEVVISFGRTRRATAIDLAVDDPADLRDRLQR